LCLAGIKDSLFVSAAPIISVDNLCKTFGTVRAVGGVSFEVERGKVVGFIGANGAGKTTTMRMLVTLELPDSGEIRVCGHDVVEEPGAVRQKVGWMPDAYGTYENMTVYEYLDFYGRAFGFSGKERSVRIERVMEFADLAPIADRPMDRLSKGMGQRLCLGRTLINEPEVLVLDEPAAGLDPRARIEFKNLIRLLAGEGKTIFISSHILSELGEMCDHLLFIDAGKIAHAGTTESLVDHHDVSTLLEIRVAGDSVRLMHWLAESGELPVAARLKDGARVRLPHPEPEYRAGLLRRMLDDGLDVCGFFKVERKLEDAFVDVLRKKPPPLPPEE
jgi:ABC-2 type transport system ATP-binding protein